MSVVFGGNELLGLIGRANLLDRMLSHAFGWQVTPTFNLLILVFGLALILVELRRRPAVLPPETSPSIEGLGDSPAAVPENGPIAVNPPEATTSSPIPNDAFVTPNLKLVSVKLVSVEFSHGHLVREVNGNTAGAVPAYVAIFRNEPTGDPIKSALDIGAKITFTATGLPPINVIGVWADGWKEASFVVGTEQRLWLAVMPKRSVPLTVEFLADGRNPPKLAHNFLTAIRQNVRVMVFDRDGARVAEDSTFALDLDFGQ